MPGKMEMRRRAWLFMKILIFWFFLINPIVYRASAEEGKEISEIRSENGYEDLLNLYRQGYDEGWESKDYIDHDLCYIFGYDPAAMTYFLYDINGDGVYELLTGMGDVAQDYLKYGYCYEIYTLIDDKPAKVAEGTERCRYSITKDGLICYFWTGGAAVNGWDYFLLPDGSIELEDVIRIAADGNYYESENCAFVNTVPPYDHDNDEMISAERMEQITDSYEYVTGMFRPISEYRPDNFIGKKEEAVSDIENARSIYGTILEEYRAALNGNEELYTLSLDNPNAFREKFPHVAMSVPKVVYEWHERIAYAFYDVDGNGTEELLIGYYGGSPCIYDVVTNNGEAVFCNFKDDWIGEGSSILIFDTGQIQEMYEHFGYIYEISDDGYSMQTYNNYTSDWFEHPDAPYKIDGEYINYDTFRTMLGTEIHAEWVPF